MIINHEWQREQILILLRNYIKRIKRGRIAEEYEAALDDFLEQLGNGQQSINYRQDENSLLNVIIKEALSMGRGGNIRNNQTQNLLQAVATLYYDNTGEWPDQLSLSSKLNFR